MNSVARYQPQALYAEYGAVKTYRGLDPLTGLPVLMYRFPGEPTLEPGELDSPNVPGVLAAHSFQGSGELVVAHSSGYRRTRPPLSRSEALALTTDTARALRDAARVNAVHGDLRVERFLKAERHVAVEGYGVPWPGAHVAIPRPPDCDPLAHDVFAWAFTMLELAEPLLPDDVCHLLQECLAQDPASRPTANDLWRRLNAQGGHKQVAVPASEEQFEFDIDSGFKETFGSLPRAHDPGVESTRTAVQHRRFIPSAPPGATSKQPRLRESTHREGGFGWFAQAEPSVKAGPLSQPQPTSATALPDADRYHVRDLPTSAVSKVTGAPSQPHGAESGQRERSPFEPPSPRGRRIAMLIALVIASVVLVVLATSRQGDAAATSAAQPGAAPYSVSVDVEPAGLANVRLVVVSSPSGSAMPPGHEISLVPGLAILDSAGFWRLAGRQGDRVSEPVLLEVPEQRSLTLVMPEAE